MESFISILLVCSFNYLPTGTSYNKPSLLRAKMTKYIN